VATERPTITPAPPAPAPAQVPTVGRIVHYRVGGDDDAPELRPAIVVRDWGGGCVNLQVFLDGRNDDRHAETSERECIQGTAWRTSVTEGAEVGQWRWPARS